MYKISQKAALYLLLEVLRMNVLYSLKEYLVFQLSRLIGLCVDYILTYIINAYPIRIKKYIKGMELVFLHLFTNIPSDLAMFHS